MTITLTTTELGKLISVTEFKALVVGLGIGLLVVIVIAIYQLFNRKNKRKRKK